jgi:DNA-binding beta-propeller fold protein YncE
LIPAQLAPVGLAFSPDGRWLYSTSEGVKLPSAVGSLSVIDVAKAETDPAHIVVADSNRFAVGAQAASLAVVDTTAALAGKPALLGYLPAGRFPQEMALEPGGAVLLVSNFGSGQLEAVDVADLP